LLTPYFGGIKGKAELDLLELSKSSKSLEVINVRPGGVDWRGHTEVEEGLKGKKSPLALTGFGVVFSVMGAVMPGKLTPTKDLGRFLTELALGVQPRPTGEGVFQEGGIVSNAAIRRLTAGYHHEK
jgi:hypothetical protein